MLFSVSLFFAIILIMHELKKILFLFYLSLFLISCKKNQLGGKSIIEGKVAHHSAAVANATVYIKFNATEFPGTDVNNYDVQLVTDADGNYKINCYQGNYYLFGYGYDAGVKEFVRGGVPVKIRTNEMLQIEVAVTE